MLPVTGDSGRMGAVGGADRAASLERARYNRMSPFSPKKCRRFLASLATTPVDSYINRMKIKLPVFWAAIAASIVSSVMGVCFIVLLSNMFNQLLISFLGSMGELVTIIVCFCLPSLLAVILFSAVVRREVSREVPGDGQTHCRKCGYILRGLQEPRCSECGEPI
jgi:hypothetical protein